MAIASSRLPEAIVTDGRYVTSGYDANLVAWPATKNGIYDLQQKSGFGTASKTISKGPDVPTNGATGPGVVTIVYNDVVWFAAPNTAIAMPQFLIDQLSLSGSPYTLT